MEFDQSVSEPQIWNNIKVTYGKLVEAVFEELVAAVETVEALFTEETDDFDLEGTMVDDSVAGECEGDVSGEIGLSSFPVLKTDADIGTCETGARISFRRFARLSVTIKEKQNQNRE